MSRPGALGRILEFSRPQLTKSPIPGRGWLKPPERDFAFPFQKRRIRADAESKHFDQVIFSKGVLKETVEEN